MINSLIHGVDGPASKLLDGCTIQGALVSAPVSKAITAVGDSIPSTHHVCEIDPDGNYVLTSTPTIDAGAESGTTMIITNIDAALSVTLQDETSLAGTKIRGAGGGDVVIAAYGSVKLHFASDGFWHQVQE